MLKRIGTLDVDGDLRTWQPPGAAFTLTLDLEIGAAGGADADLFHLYVTSPAYLVESLSDADLEDGRHLLLTKTFDHDRIRAWIDEVLSRCGGADWDEVAARLSRWFAWEYEELQEPGA